MIYASARERERNREGLALERERVIYTRGRERNREGLALERERESNLYEGEREK